MNNKIMQNKPNLLDIQTNVSSVKRKDYENKRLCSREKNKPKQSQFAQQQNEHNLLINKGL